ncbi:MAG: tRNA dihydrouridine synthase DusB [Burkholderiaceae bacterium]
MQLGPYTLPNNLFLAPMAGVTDRPFRTLCKRLGAGHAVSEMAASNPQLWATDKSTRRLNHDGESAPIAVQIAGSDPAMLAHAAVFNIERGAQIIDLNMGCPAKKVCQVAAGSALLKNETLVANILQAVVTACEPHGVPVTLKFRTGWSPANKNALTIGRLAEDLGIALVTLHGRTRACGYAGHAEYDTIADLKSRVRIPVVANGDIRTPQEARAVLAHTKADAVMIGRAAQGRPWIFREIAHFLATGDIAPPPTVAELHALMRDHLIEHHAFYGAFTGVRTARKHLQWYFAPLLGTDHPFLTALMGIAHCPDQIAAVDAFFTNWQRHSAILSRPPVFFSASKPDCMVA